MGNFGKIVSSFATNVPRVTKNNHVGSNSSVSSVNKNNATIKNTKLNQKQSEELDFSTQKLGAGVNTTRNSAQNLGAVANATNKIFSSIKVDLNKGSITSLANNVKSYYNSYEYLEKQMIKVAKEYVINNNLVVTDEIYLDASKLNMNIKDNCSKISGVFVDNNYNILMVLNQDI